MVKVKDLIEILKAQNQEALVYVLERQPGTGYYDQGGTCKEVPFDPKEHLDTHTFTSGRFEGQTHLTLGLL
jgi:hypothetical protein